MGWIKERILAERRKHNKMPWGIDKFDLDWAGIAEMKIKAEIKMMMCECPEGECQEKYLRERFDNETRGEKR